MFSRSSLVAEAVTVRYYVTFVIGVATVASRRMNSHRSRRRMNSHRSPRRMNSHRSPRRMNSHRSRRRMDMQMLGFQVKDPRETAILPLKYP